MFSIRNMKVGARLGAVFGIVMLALFGVTTLGVMNATGAISFSRAMAEKTEGTVALSNAQSAVWALRWGVAQFIAITDANDRKQIVEAQAMIRKQFDDAMGIYQRSVDTEEESAIFKELNGAFEKYAGARSKWFELHDSGKIEEAAKFRAEELTQAGRATVKALSSLIELQQKQAETQGRDMVTTMSQRRILFVGVSGLALLAAVVLAWLLARSVTRPLQRAVEVAGAVAKGDLTQHIEVKSTDEVGQLLQALKDMNESLTGIVSGVRGSTDTITTTAHQIAAGNSDLSQRTEEQATSLEETAGSMEELTSTVKQNAENAKQANQMATNASDIAVKGGQVVDDVVHTMASISDSSKKIVDIISVIEGIAFQTNILALNAAVEAARAGEQGRGFAVVAGEVRNLAQRSAAAAKEIKALIGDSVDKVDTGSRQVDLAGATMNEIVTAVKRVTDIMAEIAAASNEQGAGIEQVNLAIIQMDKVTQQNSAQVEEAAAAAESMQEQAVVLMEAVSIFKLGAEKEHTRTAATKLVAAPAPAALIKREGDRTKPNRTRMGIGKSSGG
jgi:methyl-accepting chemotaxis protein